eukprot:360513-Chlamydomonas_euryale.AAC.2
MPLLYASVSRGIATQAEYAAAEGNFGGVAAELLDKAARNEVRQGSVARWSHLDGITLETGEHRHSAACWMATCCMVGWRMLLDCMLHGSAWPHGACCCITAWQRHACCGMAAFCMVLHDRMLHGAAWRHPACRGMAAWCCMAACGMLLHGCMLHAAA